MFFGRQRQIDDLLRRLDEVPLVAVAGASGCGKSSLVLAGLLRALERRHATGDPLHWRPVVMRPGSEPIGNLARPLAAALSSVPLDDGSRVAALAGRLRLGGVALVEAVRLARLPEHARVLVVVDQFEEIFRYRRMTDADECTAFVKLLLHAAAEPDAPVRVVLTMRSDALGFCADFRDLPEAVSRGQYLVPRLTREQRKQAITGPVERSGFTIAPRLLQRVLNDVTDDFDDLPVMQHVLACTWRRWAQQTGGCRPIDVEDYVAVGTAAHALSNHADEAFHSLADLQPVVEHVFTALTERIGAAGSEVRRPLPFEQLCAVTGADPTQVAAVVDRYRRDDTVFLLPHSDLPLTESAVIDISHESLIRGWTRLNEWAERESLSAQMYRRIADAARLHGQKQEGLLHDPALQFALDWREHRQPTPAWAALYEPGFEPAMAFLEASRVARDARRRESERARRRKRLSIAVVVVAVPALVLGGLLIQSRAERKALIQAAKEETLRATSRRLALESTRSLAAGKVDLALLLGAAAMQIKPTAESQRSMHSALANAPMRFLRAREGAFTSMGFSRDGSRLVTATNTGSLVLWDTARGEPVDRDPRPPEAAHALPLAAIVEAGTLRLSPDAGGRAFVRSASGAIVPAQAASASGVATPAADAYPPIENSAIHAGRGLFASVDGEGGIRIRDLRADKFVVTLPGGAAGARLAFSPDGKTLASAQPDHRVLLWDLASAVPASTPLEGVHGDVTSLVFSPDGRFLVVLSADGRPVLWDVGGRRELRLPLEVQAEAALAAFSPDSCLLALGGVEGAVFVLDVATGALLSRSDEERGRLITSLVFSPDGRTLAAGSRDGTVSVWATDHSHTLLRRIKAHPVAVSLLAFNADATTLASAGEGTAMLWDLSGARVRHGEVSPSLDAVAAVAFDPAHGQGLAMASEDSSVWLRDLGRDRAEPRLPRGQDDALTSVAYSPDGQWLAAGTEGAQIQLWHADRFATLGSSASGLGHTDRVSAVAFSPDGLTLASGGRDNAVFLWEPQAQPVPLPQRLPLRLEKEVTSVAFSPGDGHLLAIGSRSGTITLWDRNRNEAAQTSISGDGGVTTVAFSPDGLWLAASSLDKTIRFWNVRSGAEEGRMIRQSSGVTAMAFDPLGRWMVSGGNDGTVRLWNVEARRQMGEAFEGHDEPVFSVAFRGDGKTVASSGADRHVILWDIDLPTWNQRACRIVQRDLANEEWPGSLEDVPAADRQPCASWLTPPRKEKQP